MIFWSSESWTIATATAGSITVADMCLGMHYSPKLTALLALVYFAIYQTFLRERRRRRRRRRRREREREREGKRIWPVKRRTQEGVSKGKASVLFIQVLFWLIIATHGHMKTCIENCPKELDWYLSIQSILVSAICYISFLLIFFYDYLYSRDTKQIKRHICKTEKNISEKVGSVAKVCESILLLKYAFYRHVA